MLFLLGLQILNMLTFSTQQGLQIVFSQLFHFIFKLQLNLLKFFLLSLLKQCNLSFHFDDFLLKVVSHKFFLLDVLFFLCFKIKFELLSLFEEFEVQLSNLFLLRFAKFRNDLSVELLLTFQVLLSVFQLHQVDLVVFFNFMLMSLFELFGFRSELTC